MASLIKSQIIKNLARYTKNLSADNVNLSLFKGEGEFLNLQLDENVLHSVLHMPQWLRIEKVTCNRVSWKIPWTKLKTEAIAIKFDAIYVEISAIGPNDKPNSSVQLANTSTSSGSKSTSTKYGFIDKVIDSICFSINSVDIKFGSPGFQALLHASRIQLRSTNPLWQVADLRSTRIVHDKSDQVIFFKEVLLSAIKLEASVTAGCEDKPTPLRLITSHSSLKITVKKRISDSGIICGKLELVLDDILWVLSEKQLKASVAFVKSVVDIMRQSHEHTRNTTKDDKQTTGSTNSEKNPMKYDLETPYAQSPVNMSDKPIDRLFWRYNVLETSFHIVTSRIDFHFCGGLQSRRDSSTMQVLLDRLSLDYYPEHIAGATRQHWQKHDNISLSRSTWSHQLLTSFFDNNPHLNGYKKFLFEGALLMRLQDITISQLRSFTDDNDGDGKDKIKPLLSSERTLKIYPALSIDHTFYFYNYMSIQEKMKSKLELPNSNLFVSTTNIQCTIVDTTILWANAFVTNVFSSWESTKLSKQQEKKDESMDIKIDMKTTTLTIDLPIKEKLKLAELHNVPSALRVRVSQINITNSIFNRIAHDTYKLSKFYLSKKFFKGTSFPNKTEDLRLIPDVLSYKDSTSDTELEWIYNAKCPSWQVDCKRVSIDFVLDDELSTFMEPMPISLWIYSYKELNKDDQVLESSGNSQELVTNPDLSILVDMKNKLNIVLNHMEYLFILRLQASLMQLNRDLGSSPDTSSQKTGLKLSFALLISELELGLLLPRSPYSDSCELCLNDDQNTDDNTGEINNLSDSQNFDDINEVFNLLDDSNEDVVIEDDIDQSKDAITEYISNSPTIQSNKILGKPKTHPSTTSLSDVLAKTSKKVSERLDTRAKKNIPAETNTSTSGLLASTLSNIGLLSSAIGVTTVAAAIAELDIKPVTALIDIRNTEEINEYISDDEDSSCHNQAMDDINSVEYDKVDYSDVQLTSEQLERLRNVNLFYGSPDDTHTEVCIVMIKLQQLDLGIQILGSEMIMKVTSRYGTVREMGNVDLAHFVGRKARVITPPLKHSQHLFDSQVRGRITISNGSIFAHMKLNGIYGNLMATNLTNMNRFFLDDTVDTVKPGMAFIFEIYHSLISILNDNSDLVSLGLNILPVQMLIRETAMYRSSSIFEEDIKQIVDNRDFEEIQRTTQASSSDDDQHDEIDYTSEIRDLVYSDAPLSESKDTLPKRIGRTLGDPYADAPLSRSGENSIIKSPLDRLKEDNERLFHLLKVTQSALKAKRDEQLALVKTVHHLEDELLSSYHEQNKLLRLASSISH